MREGQYEYIHEFKERVNEIMDLQKKHHEIIDRINIIHRFNKLPWQNSQTKHNT